MQRLWWLVWLVITTAGVLSAQTEQTVWTGKIAYIGEDYNVYTYWNDGTSYTLTQNGSETRRYQWLTWSQDDQLAYFCCALDAARDLRTGAYLSVDGQTTGREVWSGFGTQVIYAAWSPAPCQPNGCQLLSLLLNDVLQGGLRVTLLDTQAERVREIEVAKGSPFYYSFNADGSQILLHRNNRDIEFYNVVSQDLVRERAQRSSGMFQTPSWSPIDNRAVIATEGSSRQTTNLTVLDEEGRASTIISDLRGNISFLWSPDGRYIAYRSISSRSISSVFVVDVSSGEIVARSPVDHVMAFFWSPDSRRLAYVTPYRLNGGFGKPNLRQFTQQRQRATLSWSILDVVENHSVLLAPFVPTYEMSYLLTYFDQFAQSHRVWSPDSRYLVYSDNANGMPTVQVLDVTQGDSPITLARGRYAVWSFR